MNVISSVVDYHYIVVVSNVVLSARAKLCGNSETILPLPSLIPPVGFVSDSSS